MSELPTSISIDELSQIPSQPLSPIQSKKRCHLLNNNNGSGTGSESNSSKGVFRKYYQNGSAADVQAYIRNKMHSVYPTNLKKTNSSSTAGTLTNNPSPSRETTTDDDYDREQSEGNTESELTSLAASSPEVGILAPRLAPHHPFQMKPTPIRPPHVSPPPTPLQPMSSCDSSSLYYSPPTLSQTLSHTLSQGSTNSQSTIAPQEDPNPRKTSQKERRRPPPIITSLDLENYKILSSNSSEKNANRRRPPTPGPGANGRIILVEQHTPPIPPINSSNMSFTQIAHSLTLRRNSLVRGGKSKRWKMTRRDDRQFM
jgi:hypothetical protein